MQIDFALPIEVFRVFDDFGLNVAGYLTAELGLGEVARNYVSVIQQLGVQTSLQDASFITHQRKGASQLTAFTTENPYPANLVCINAPEIKHFIERFGVSYFRTKYNIGSWWWEVEDLPREWQNEFYRFDELWVGTSFIQRNLARVSPVPVYVVQPYVVPLSAVPVREELKLANDDFVFLFAFDYFSCFERKNPISTVRAFKLAFKGDERVKLLIKTTNAEKFKAKSDALIAEAGGDPRIVLLDKYCTKEELNNIIASCDAYVSLHRTEGFGLPIAEAMLLHKPVIATGWSGNLDFTTEENSLLVKHEFSVNTEDYGPYKVGMRWAEPDVDHAAKLMRILYEDRAYAKLLGERGAATIKEQFGRKAVERVVAERLTRISAKVQRVAQIDKFKKGLLELEAPSIKPGSHLASGSLAKSEPDVLSNSEASAVDNFEKSTATPDSSDRVVDKVEMLLTSWWHRPMAGKPLRLLSKCVARYVEKLLTGDESSKFRRDLIETSFEGVAKLVKSDYEQIEKLESRVKQLEAEASTRKNQ
jgi:glycosyltransferase involved in cell wall biosynthesis